jgi:hypothetical protein
MIILKKNVFRVKTIMLLIYLDEQRIKRPKGPKNHQYLVFTRSFWSFSSFDLPNNRASI